MGQYCIPVILNDDGTVFKYMSPYDYDHLGKINEHGYYDSDFVSTVIYQFSPNGNFRGKKLVWLGQYSEGKMYEYCKSTKSFTPKLIHNHKYKIVVNHTKGEYIKLENKFNNLDLLNPLVILTLDNSDHYPLNTISNFKDYWGRWNGDNLTSELIEPINYKLIKSIIV